MNEPGKPETALDPVRHGGDIADSSRGRDTT